MQNILGTIAVVLILTPLGTLPTLAASQAQLDNVTVSQEAKTSAQAVSVLERFRTYSGPRTPAALTALFTDPVVTTIRQYPTVALTDGATMVRITIDAASPENKSPNVALNEAQLISLKRSNADKWDIEALPAAGTWNASLIVLTGSGTKTVPLTVAPRLPAGTDLSVKGFSAFLGGTKASARPLLDLNGDGRRDYLDDYIFTANYLVGPITTAAMTETVQAKDYQAPISEQTRSADDAAPSRPQSSAPDPASSLQTTTLGSNWAPLTQPSAAVQGNYSDSRAGREPEPAQQTAGVYSSPNSPSSGSPASLKLAPGVAPSSDPHNLNNRNLRAREKTKSIVPASGAPTSIPAQ